jgi:hypothetical protein
VASKTWTEDSWVEQWWWFDFFRFRTEHLQELPDKLWPRLSGYIVGTKEKIRFGKEKYSAPFEAILLLCLHRLARPNFLRREMEGFFGQKVQDICWCQSNSGCLILSCDQVPWQPSTFPPLNGGLRSDSQC